jgi:hypothetical protein
MSSSFQKIRIAVRKGASAAIPLRLETGTLSFAAISAMDKSAPLRVTATGHNIPDGWYVAIVDSNGMTELNASDSNAIRDSEFHRITWVDADTLEFDGISSANFTTYTSGGYLAFYAPMSLASYTSARMDVKTRVGGDVILALNTTDGTLEIEETTSTLWIRLEDDALDAVAARDYVFDIEMVSATAVDALCSAKSVLTVLPEVTTSV